MPKLKPLNEQVIVVTGASSGIGLATAQRAAKRGARVLLASRNHDALKAITDEINKDGGDAAYVVADVGVREDVERIAQCAAERFGGFDTWVNDAGVGIFARIEAVSEEDARRLFDTNFWGVVNGSQIALRQLKSRGGALINVGSIESDIAVPLHGVYAASKHAVKAFTDALRAELREEGAPVSVTLIKPGSIGTPMLQNFKNEMPEEARFPPPVYRPEDVALAILHAAVHPKQEIYVGSAAKMMSLSKRATPKLFDRIGSLIFMPLETQDEPNRTRRDNLYAPAFDGQVRGEHPGMVRPSLYTRASLHPVITGAALLTGLLAAAAIIKRKEIAEAAEKLAPVASRWADRVGETAGSTGERLAKTAEGIGGRLSSAFDQVSDTARRLPRRARPLRRNLSDIRKAVERRAPARLFGR
ncbi:MAG TPA: SDR family oxidoreductase [Caulobacteraceae bacterium]|jgi:short-subunit dehydrogenase